MGVNATMKKFLLKFLKKLLKTIGLLFILILIYSLFLYRDIKKVDDFCSEMKPGLAVNEIANIARKHDVVFDYARKPDSVKNGTLGFKMKDRENTWFFAVGAPMTVGEHGCGVYHNNQVVLSSKSGGTSLFGRRQNP